MGDIFVSYKREDQAAIEPLVHLLEARGFSVWWDPSIVPGERFASVIRDALSHATCVIVGWSSRSIESFWVQDEASVARDRGILIPISIDGAQPPLGFRQLQTTNLADWHGQADDPRIEHLLAGIRRIMGKANQSDSTVAYTAEQYRIPKARPRRWTLTFPIRGIGRRWAPGAVLTSEGDIIGLITIMSLAATVVLSIFGLFLTEYFGAGGHAAAPPRA
jgi:TIR domain